RLELRGLADDVVDQVWGMHRQQQSDALRQWVRSRGKGGPSPAAKRAGFKNLLDALRPRAGSPRLPQALPAVAQPPFAPDRFPEWLFKGELSSLGRRMDEAG